jgi:hypothetical protein
MQRGLVYADTSIWNELCDQGTDPNALAARLNAHGARLVLGMNVFYEMVRTFAKLEADAMSRGSALFSYLKLWTRSSIAIMRQNPEILAEEVRCCEGKQAKVNPMPEGADCRRFLNEIDSLAEGKFGPLAQEFVAWRKDFAKGVRTDMANDLQDKPELKSQLQSIKPAQLSDWIASELTNERGTALLAGHIMHVLPQHELADVIRIAKKMLDSSKYRIARSLVRNGIYLNWRIANRQSLRGDVPDDSYHVVSASYADFFTTTDADQANQVRHTIPALHVCVYDRTDEILNWLPRSIVVSD